MGIFDFFFYNQFRQEDMISLGILWQWQAQGAVESFGALKNHHYG